MTDADDDLVAVGRLGRPHGLRGHLRVSASGPTLAAAVPPMAVVIRGPNGRRDAQVVEVSGTGERLLVRVSGAGDRDTAAGLTGHQLLVPRDRLPRLTGQDEFYVRDLVGLDVEVDGRRVGELVDVLSRPAHDVLEIRARDGRLLLVPFVAAAVRSVERERGALVVEGWAFEEPE